MNTLLSWTDMLYSDTFYLQLEQVVHHFAVVGVGANQMHRTSLKAALPRPVQVDDLRRGTTGGKEGRRSLVCIDFTSCYGTVDNMSLGLEG